MTVAHDLHQLIDAMVESVSGESDTEPGLLPPIWQTIVDLGLDRVGIGEDGGGSGGDLADLAVIVEDLARHGLSTPVIEASVASWLLGRSGQLSDSGLATVVIHESDLSWDPETGLLSGVLACVPWARSADSVVLVTPRASWCVRIADAGVTISPGANVAGEPRDAVVLDRCRPKLLSAQPPLPSTRARLGLLWSAAILGAGRAAYVLTRDYVSQRHQFGKPLIQIPAVAAHLAMMRVAVLQVETALHRAIAAMRQCASAQQQLAVVAAARSVAGNAATELAQIAHQCHGAMGIAAEYPLHRLTRRLWAWQDAEQPLWTWNEMLGFLAVHGGEHEVWDRLTA